MTKTETQELRDWSARLMGWELHPDFTYWRKELSTAKMADGSPVYAEYYTGYLAQGANPIVVPVGTLGFWAPDDPSTGQIWMVVERVRELGLLLILDVNPNHYSAVFVVDTDGIIETITRAKDLNPCLTILLAARAIEEE